MTLLYLYGCSRRSVLICAAVPYDPKQYDILLRALHKAHDVAPPIGPKLKASHRTIIESKKTEELDSDREMPPSS
jgi:hypothetical protein